MKCFPLCYCADAVQYTHAVSEDALNGALIKGHEQSLGEHPQEVQSLIILFQQLRWIHAPGEILLNVDSQKF